MSIIPSNIPRVVSSSTWSGDPQRNPPGIKYSDPLGAETRRSEVEKIQESFVRVNKVSGRIKLIGIGQLVVPIDWPVWFIEWPNFCPGYELDEASPLDTSNFPTWSVTVSAWEKQTAGELGEYWIGANLAIVINGNPDQIGWVHWAMEGKAMNTIGTSESGTSNDTGQGVGGLV